MNKYVSLLKNLSVLTISSVATKFLSFILLPLYTGILTTSEYGTYDLYYTTISLLFPVLSLCISDSLVRFLLKSENKEEIITISLKYTVFSTILFLIFFSVNCYFDFIPPLNEYKLIFVLLFLSNAVHSFFTGMARGLEKIKDIAVASFLCGALTISLNILFLVFFKMGLVGYFGATLIGLNVANIYFFLRLKRKHVIVQRF